MNYKSIFRSHKSKNCKTSIFYELLFPKYDNFKIISTDNDCLSLCLELNEWGWTIKEQNFINHVCGYTLKLKIVKIFFMKWYLFLNSNLVINYFYKIWVTNNKVNSTYPFRMFFHRNKLSEGNASMFKFTPW